MRITYVGAVPPIGGGIAQHGGRLVGALRELGHDVDVLSWRAQYPRRMYAGASQVRDGATPLEGARHVLHWGDPTTWVRAGLACRDRDLLVYPWITPAQAPALWTISRAAGRRPVNVAMVHNSTPHEGFPLAGPLTRLGLRRTGRLVAHARAVLEELGELGVARPSAIVPHPPNLAISPTQLPSGSTVRLAFLGFIRAYKGPDLAIEVLSRLQAQGVDATLTVAGEPWDDIQPLRSLAVDIGVADRVTFIDRYVGDDELRAIIAEHHIVLLPYRSATQSGIVPLAHAGGRPVVATRVGGLADQVRDGVTGRLAPTLDVAALASATMDVIADLDEYARRAAAAAPTWIDVARAVTGST